MDKLLEAARLVGDARATGLYSVPLPSINWATAVTDEVMAQLRPDLDVTVRYTPQHPTGAASILRAAGLTGQSVGQCIPRLHGCRIDLYPGGRDVGTLAHELAHAVGGSGHDDAFRSAHSQILDLLERA